MTKLDLCELHEQLKQKEIAAFEQMYDLYAAALLGYILRHGCSSKQGERILACIFLKAWQRIESFNPVKQQLFTWLFQLTKDEIVIRYGRAMNPFGRNDFL